jgi:shikimate dehydrogenase
MSNEQANLGDVWPVSGSTALYVIVGDPVGQVRSPQIVNALFAQARIDALLVPLHVPRQGFAAIMQALMQIPNLKGIVLTVPFKVEARALVNRVLEVGVASGAINAMRRTLDGGWEGEMFDGLGLVEALRMEGVPVAGKRVLLVGAGGAGRAIATALAHSKAAWIDISDVDTSRAADVAASVAGASPACKSAVAPPTFAGHDIVINATPSGMKASDPLPIELQGMGAGHVLFDIVPKPDVTELMEHAMKLGAKTIGGKRMIEGQANALVGFFGYNIPG